MTATNQINRAHVGPSLEDFLKDEGIFEEVDAAAKKRVQAVRDARANSTIRPVGKALGLVTFRAFHRNKRYIAQDRANRPHRNWFIKFG
jgi:hypothetical protein